MKRANTMTPPAETEKTAPTWEEFKEEFVAPAPAAPEVARSKPRFIPLLRHRWVRKLLRLAGVRPPHVPLQKCQGMTRVGQPCRGPAMANGFCRLHGGSRHISVME